MKNTINHKYDLSAIMRRAWAIRRAAAADMGCSVSAVIWGECLRLAWAEAEAPYAAANADALAAEWAALDTAAQMRFMTACVRKAAKNDIGYSTEDHYLQFTEVPAFALHGHEFDEFVNETWLRIAGKLADPAKLARVNEKRAASGKRPLSLQKLVYDSAHASIAAIYYADIKHGRACVREIVDADGDTYSYVETMASARRDNTESSAIARVIVEQVISRFDLTGRRIWSYNRLGLTEREIAQYVGISNVAVHKRIAKMKKAVADALAA